MNRYSRPRQRSWLVPSIVVIGIAGFFVWESGWQPFQVLDAPTGTLADAENPASGQPASPDPYGDLPDIAPGQSEPDVGSLNEREMLHEFSRRRTADGVRSASANSDEIRGNSVQPASFVDETPRFDEERFADLTQKADPPNGGLVAVRPPMDAALAAKMTEVDNLLREGDYLTAHRGLSEIYWNYPEQRSTIRTRIERTSASIYADPQPHYVKPYVVRPNDTLGGIAQKYKVPWTYLARLNRVSPKRIREGSKLKVIKGPFGAVVDLRDFRLTIHAHGYYVRHYTIGIGADNSTPTGEFTVQNRLENPPYYPPEGGRVEADDPDNPLGERWLGIGDGYGIHGTIAPDSIGRAESRGCIRLREKDINEVFDLLAVGSTVLIRR